jgi:uncharacterized peroxidase-related enzyme
MTEEEEATGELKEMYDQLTDPKTNQVDNILKIHGQHPATLSAHVLLYKTVMYGKSKIRRPEREMIAVVVSSLNECHYWLTHHRAGLLRLIKNEVFVNQLAEDWKKAELNEKQFTMILYAEKLTMTPGKVNENDIRALKLVGFTERDILDINQITSYFAYVNRIAEGLGVPLEDFWEGE